MPLKGSQLEARLGQHKDTGCYLLPKCLECPLPLCKDEMSQAELAALLHEDRNNEIRHLRALGTSPTTLAKLFNISKRTIQRACNAH